MLDVQTERNYSPDGKNIFYFTNVSNFLRIEQVWDRDLLSKLSLPGLKQLLRYFLTVFKQLLRYFLKYSLKVTKHLVEPLTIISAELNRRQQELFYLLERKDREIQDYKDQGVVTSRSKYRLAISRRCNDVSFFRYLGHVKTTSKRR